MYTFKEKQQLKSDDESLKENLSKKKRVDINILLNRVRADEKKQRLESVFFISIVSFAIIISGIILSFR